MTGIEEIRAHAEAAKREDGIWYSGDYLDGLASRIEAEREAVVAENARLRELVREQPACTMEPDGYYGDQHGIYRCSNCGELWQFGCDGPRENGWACCPGCAASIDYGEGGA